MFLNFYKFPPILRKITNAPIASRTLPSIAPSMFFLSKTLQPSDTDFSISNLKHMPILYFEIYPLLISLVALDVN